MSELQVEAAPSDASLWTTIRESLAGSHHGSYTEGSIDRAIVLLAIPMVLELVLESVFAVVDVFFVARVGPDAVATVGLTEAMMTLIYSVAMGLGMGATATVARRMGEKDPDGAAIAAVQAIALGLFVAIPLGLLGFSFARVNTQTLQARGRRFRAGIVDADIARESWHFGCRSFGSAEHA